MVSWPFDHPHPLRSNPTVVPVDPSSPLSPASPPSPSSPSASSSPVTPGSPLYIGTGKSIFLTSILTCMSTISLVDVRTSETTNVSRPRRKQRRRSSFGSGYAEYSKSERRLSTIVEVASPLMRRFSTETLLSVVADKRAENELTALPRINDGVNAVVVQWPLMHRRAGMMMPTGAVVIEAVKSGLSRRGAMRRRKSEL